MQFEIVNSPSSQEPKVQIEAEVTSGHFELFVGGHQLLDIAPNGNIKKWNIDGFKWRRK